jgi:hypothetical protein
MFEQVGGLISSALNRAKITDKTKSAQVMQTISEWLIEQWGQEITAIARPIYIKKKTAVIAVVNASFANELRHRQRLLIERLAERYGRDVVVSVHVEM